jgi:curved DNA-binding protein CbpA
MSEITRSKSYYEVLEVPKTASDKAIAAAYKKLALQYHPDRNRSPEATEMMQQINVAYETLRDPKKRAVYDEKLLIPAGKAKIVVHRGGAPVAIVRRMGILVDGKEMGALSWGQMETFLVEPGPHTISVRLDAGKSPAIQIHCEAGTRIKFECGAQSILGSLFAPNSFYIRQVKA